MIYKISLVFKHITSILSIIFVMQTVPKLIQEYLGEVYKD
jgi:hypothetical protein